MMQRPWDCAQPDEWLPQSLRLCWGSGDSSDGGGGFGSDSSGGGWDGGGYTGGGDWGSSGTYSAAGFDAGGIGGWGGTAYDASMPGSPAGGGGDWGSFGATNYAGFDAPNPTFADVAGPNPGVTTGGGDWGSAGTFSAAGTGGGPGGAMFGDYGTGGGGGGGGGGVFGDYGGGGGGGGATYGGGGHSMGSGLASGATGSFGSFGSGTLGGSNAVAAAPTGPTGSTFADTYGGGSLAGPAGQASSGAPTTSEAQSESAGPSESEAAPSESEAGPEAGSGAALGTPATQAPPAETEDEAAPAQDSFASRFDAVSPQQDTFASRFDAATPDAEPSSFGPQSLPGQQQQDSFDSRFGFDTAPPSPGIETSIPGGRETDFDYGPGQQTAAPNFNQAFEAFNAPGWNPSEQTAGVTGLAEPTDWGGNPLAASTDVSVGRDFDQVFADVNNQPADYQGAPYADMGPPTPGPDFNPSFQAFDTPTGMDLAGDFATGRTTDLSNQLGLQDLTVGPGLPTGPAYGISGLNLAPLTHETTSPVNVELVSSQDVPAPPPPQVEPPPLPDQPQALPEVQVQPTPEAQPTEAQPQEAQPAPPQEAQPAPPQQVEQTQPPEAQPAPPSLIEQAQQPPQETLPAQQPPGLVTMLPPPTLTPPGLPPAYAPPSETRPAETPAELDNQPDAPEPQDNHNPPGDPNAPRPSANIPGRLVGEGGQYDNAHADTPQTSRTYRDSGRTDYPQGRPGITFLTARQAGITPLFRTDGINTHDNDARLVENINRALRDMERQTGIPASSLVATSGWRGAFRTNALDHGMDPRTGQESVYSRSNPVNGPHFPAAQPGHSNHGPGMAIDFARSPALTWLKQNAGRYGLGNIRGDHPHIQLTDRSPGQRPSAEQQAEQRVIDEQNRQIAVDRGLLAPGGRGNQQAGVPAPRARPSDAPQPQVAQPRLPADIPVPANLPPQAPQETRPPADIPAPAPRGPNEFDIPVTPPVRNATVIANNILKQATAHLNTNSDTPALNAASVVAAKAMAAAGIPANLARSLMLKGALDGAIANGYGPGGSRSTVMGFSIWGKVQSTITDSINAAMRGYQPAKPGELQGPPAPPRGLAKGGHVAKDEPVVVGEEGPEYFMPDRPGTVFPHQPQPGKSGKSDNIDRWPKLPAPNFPGHYGGVEREMLRQTRAAQDPVPSLIDMINSGRLPFNEANWHAMMNDPALIALGRSRMEDRKGIDPGAEQYGAFILPPEPAAEPPDPGSPMAQALGYGSIRRPLRVGRQSYSQ